METRPSTTPYYRNHIEIKALILISLPPNPSINSCLPMEIKINIDNTTTKINQITLIKHPI